MSLSKPYRISIDECKERTARMRASKDAFIKVCSSNSYENQDEDLKVIDVSPIKSLFFNMNMIHLYLEGVPRILNLLILMLNSIKVRLKKLKP